MNLDKMLEYQKIDQDVYKKELELSRSKEVEKINDLKNRINFVQDSLLKANRETEELYHTIEKLEGEAAALAQEKARLADGVNTLEKIEALETVLNNYLELLSNIEKDAQKAFERLNAISKDAAKQYELGTQLSMEFRKSKSVYAEMFEKLKEQCKPQLQALAALKKDIDDELFKKYKIRRDNKKMPAMVSYNAADGRCTACGFDIKIEVDDKLKQPGDVAECPHCRRLVYFK